MITPATYGLTDENGDGFALVRRTDGSCDLRVKKRGAVTIDRHFPVRWETAQKDEFFRVLEFWLSAARAILEDRDAGSVRESLMVDTYVSRALRIGIDFHPGCCPEDEATVCVWAWGDAAEDLDIFVLVSVSKDELWGSVEDMDTYYPHL